MIMSKLPGRIAWLTNIVNILVSYIESRDHINIMLWILTYNAKATFSRIVDGPRHNTNPRSPVMYMSGNSISKYQDNSVYKTS